MCKNGGATGNCNCKEDSPSICKCVPVLVSGDGWYAKAEHEVVVALDADKPYNSEVTVGGKVLERAFRIEVILDVQSDESCVKVFTSTDYDYNRTPIYNASSRVYTFPLSRCKIVSKE